MNRWWISRTTFEKFTIVLLFSCMSTYNIPWYYFVHVGANSKLLCDSNILRYAFDLLFFYKGGGTGDAPPVFCEEEIINYRKFFLHLTLILSCTLIFCHIVPSLSYSFNVLLFSLKFSHQLFFKATFKIFLTCSQFHFKCSFIF